MLILASVTAMAFGDAIIKLVSSNLTVWQVFVVRSAFAVPCLLFLRCPIGAFPVAIFNRWGVLRSVLLVLTWLVFYASLPVLSLSVAAVAVYTNPIITAILSAIVLRERVSKWQMFGVLVGFIGVVAVLRPGTEGFTSYIVLPLLGAALYSVAMVLTRSKCQDNNPIDLALSLHFSFIAAGLLATVVLASLSLTPMQMSAYPFLTGSWGVMALGDWALMAFLGVLSAAFSFGVARAYQIAPPQIIGTFDYAYLLSAAIWGVVFFAETPDAYTLIGMVLITIAGVIVSKQRSSVVDQKEHP